MQSSVVAEATPSLILRPLGTNPLPAGKYLPETVNTVEIRWKRIARHAVTLMVTPA
jgi:hypothetical protein